MGCELRLNFTSLELGMPPRSFVVAMHLSNHKHRPSPYPSSYRNGGRWRNHSIHCHKDRIVGRARRGSSGIPFLITSIPHASHSQAFPELHDTHSISPKGIEEQHRPELEELRDFLLASREPYHLTSRLHRNPTLSPTVSLSEFNLHYIHIVEQGAL